jgi:hypothetical protein
MNEPLVSIIITTWNRKKDTMECLKSLYSQNYSNYEIILVDNGSEDNTPQEIRKKFQKVYIVENKKNLGIAGGRNSGLRFARGSYILFLDSDTIVDKNMIRELINVIEKGKKIGIVVPKMYFLDTPNLIWYAGAKVNLLTSRTQNIGAYEIDQGQYDEVSETSHGPTAFLCRKELIDKIGGHDEDYFMSYADLDFAIRTKKAGFKVLYVPSAKLWHKISAGKDKNPIRDLLGTFPFRAYYFARNRIIFMKKNVKFLNFIFFLLFFEPFFISVYIIKIVLYNQWKYLKMYLKGIRDGVYYTFTNRVVSGA